MADPTMNAPAPAAPVDNIESILRSSSAPQSVRADAWDAYTQSANSDDLAARLKKLPLDNNTRAALWDAKEGEAHFSATATTAAPESFLHKTGQFLLHNPVTDLVAGAGSGVASTALGAYNLARKIPGADKVLPEASAAFKEAADAPDSLAGKAGKFLEQGAEFMIPMSRVAKALEGTPAAARILGEMLAASGVSGVQSGGDPTTMLETGLTTGALGTAGAVAGPAAKAVATPILQAVIDASPRPLSQGAEAIAQRFGVPLTRGMQGGSRTVQAAEKMLGHTVAPDLYEPAIEEAQQGLNKGAQSLSGGFATDKYSAGDNTIKTMLGEAKGHETAAQNEYAKLAQIEADPANTRSVQVGTKSNPTADPTQPDTVPDLKDIGLPVDMRPTKQALAPLEDEISRRMTPAQRRADPGLAAIQNILTRPDALPASTAEADLSYLKSILRGEYSGQAKRVAGKAIDALQTQVDDAVAQAGPGALKSLQTARAAWKARSEILDVVKELAGDESGQTGQVLLANKLLQPSDASFPALQKVLAVAPGAADDLGKAFLTERVFRNVAGGSDFTNAKQAGNLWNQIGKRTKAALYTPDQIADVDNLIELAKRIGENPNPSNTGSLNAMLKMGVMMLNPIKGGASIALGRNVAKLLYAPGGAQALRVALSAPGSAEASKAMLLIKSAVDDTETAEAQRGAR